MVMHIGSISPWTNSTHYIIFRNVENFKSIFFSNNNFSEEEEKKFDGIFEKISFVKIESSKLINYSTNMCQSGQTCTKIMNRSNLVLFWTQSSKVCLLFRKGWKETKGLCRRKVGR